MRNNSFIFVLTSVIFLILAVSFASAIWPFTGKAIASLPERTTSCSDSDNGIENTTAGMIKYTWGSVIRRTGYSFDTCVSNKLYEFYCTNNQAKVRTLTCQKGCVNQTITEFGQTKVAWECISEVTTPPTTDSTQSAGCTDSDGLANFTVAGFVNGSDSSGSFEAVDTCLSDSRLREFICTNSGKPRAMEVACVGTAAGVCKNTRIMVNGEEREVGSCQPQPLQCSKAESVTTTTNEIGKTQESRDVCLDSKRLKQFSCDGSSAKSEIVSCDDACINGRCVVRTALCLDSDGGKNITVKGTVSNYDSEGEIIGNASDYCATSRQLVELSCMSGERQVGESKTQPVIFSKRYNCKGGCRDGSCLTTDATEPAGD